MVAGSLAVVHAALGVGHGACGRQAATGTPRSVEIAPTCRTALQRLHMRCCRHGLGATMDDPNGNPFQKYDVWVAKQKQLPVWRRVPPWWVSAVSLIIGVIGRVVVNPVGGWPFVALNLAFGLYLLSAIGVDLRRRRHRQAMLSSAS